jgi:catechol 2,3-dioxygenase-like lactoylglutathione lyase family enzyme
MITGTRNDLGFVQVKAVALAVENAERARRFYQETLGLAPAKDHQKEMAFLIGDVFLLLKPVEEWYGRPTKELNARITLQVQDSYATEQALIERGVTVSDAVAVYGDNPIGAFLDSEGNKLWFCSEGKKK